MRKIYVICPGNAVTGGPELLHQFVSTLNNAGFDATIIYTPLNVCFKVPTQYSKYNVKVSTYQSIKFTQSDVVVIPEVLTGYVKKFSDIQKYIWWLSVDNYFEIMPKSFSESFKENVKRIIKHKHAKPKQVPIKGLADCKHLAQSEYAVEFLSENGYRSEMLSDFLNEEHLNKNVTLAKKEDIVCYNPKKGMKITQRLIKDLPHYHFVPIQNMTAVEVANLLERAKVYIDFGNHPGKDRIPREAAMAHCVVITGTRGSARNNVDIAVPEKYKIAESDSEFIKHFDSVLSEAIYAYEVCVKDFDEYRFKIKNERGVFEKQALNIFGYNNCKG
jgi:hypothetical protein